MRLPGLGLAGLAVLVLAALPGCGPRTVRETVFERDETVVRLRSQQLKGEPVERDFAHPVTIAPVRLANILSRIDVRKERTPGLVERLSRNRESSEDDRDLAVPTELLHVIGEGLAQGFERADSSQEVVVTAVRRSRRLGLFTRRHLTGLVAWVEGESLHLHFSYLDWEVPGDEDDLPEPRRDKVGSRFRVLAAEGVVPTGPHAVAVAWRDAAFRTGRSLRLSPSGKVLRRTILMESAPEEEGAAEGAGGDASPVGSGRLAPETLRELADLEEARRRGEISEAEYQARRVRILGEDPGSR